MQIQKGVLVIGLLGMATVALAQRRLSGPNYDPAKEITIQGSVQEVVTLQHRGMTGIHLNVKSSDKVFDVRVGPSWFLDEKQFKFATGDQIEVTGATISTNTGAALIAREVKKGDAVLVLRDAKGFPVWSGGRGRPRS
jgi:hypothetical protein